MIRNIPMIEASPIQTGGLRRSTNVVAAQDDVTPEERSEDLELIAKIERLPRDVGWLLLYVGALGIILPGLFGLPFMIAGTAIVAPNREKWLARLIGRNPPTRRSGFGARQGWIGPGILRALADQFLFHRRDRGGV